MSQHEGEPAKIFVERLKGQAAVCDSTLPKGESHYADQIVQHQFRICFSDQLFCRQRILPAIEILGWEASWTTCARYSPLYSIQSLHVHKIHWPSDLTLPLIQVQLQFCWQDPSAEQGDEFPPSICVQITGKMCLLPNSIPTNKPNVERKTPPRQDLITLEEKKLQPLSG